MLLSHAQGNANEKTAVKYENIRWYIPWLSSAQNLVCVVRIHSHVKG